MDWWVWLVTGLVAAGVFAVVIVLPAAMLSSAISQRQERFEEAGRVRDTTV